MERFVRRENIKHYRDLLRDAKSQAERQRIQLLLDEELIKQTAAGDEDVGSTGSATAGNGAADSRLIYRKER
jgi:hypothetical protein